MNFTSSLFRMVKHICQRKIQQTSTSLETF